MNGIFSNFMTWFRVIAGDNFMSNLNESRTWVMMRMKVNA